MITKESLKKIRNDFRENQFNKIRLNGTIIIDEFDWVAKEEYLEITFSVPEDITSASKLELINSEGNPITENLFYVTLVPNTFFKYRINFKDGGN